MLRHAHCESPHHPPNLNLLHGHGGHKPLERGNAGEEETEAPHADVAEDDAPEVQPRDIGKEHQHDQVLTEEVAEEDGVGEIVHRGGGRDGDGDNFEEQTLRVRERRE